MYPFCDKCGGVLPGGVTAMVGAYSCTCRPAINVSTGTIAPITEEDVRRIVREELDRAVVEIVNGMRRGGIS